MAAALMEKLLEIERSVGFVDPIAIRRMAMDAQNLLLEYQKQHAETLTAKVAGWTDRANALAHQSDPLPKWPEVSHQLQPTRRQPARAPRRSRIEMPSWAKG